MSTLRVAVVADSDTRWKWGAAMARRLAGEVELHAFLLRGRSTPTSRQLAEVGEQPSTSVELSLPDLVTDHTIAHCDVVVLATGGGAAHALLQGFRRTWEGKPRPVLITGYVGVVYERMVEGLLYRVGADLILANSAADAERFRAALHGVGAPAEAVVQTALPFLGQPTDRPADQPFTLTFASQPSVPATRSRRLALLRALAAHARLHPERRVLVKLRSMPGEHTTHLEEHPYQHLLAGVDAPPNLELVYGHMADVLDTTDLLVTVSSTAALESMQRGIPTAILTDLGIQETLGNHAFLASGCYASMAELDEGALPVADPAWLARNGLSSESVHDAVRSRVARLLASEDLPPIVPFYTRRNAPLLRAEILARYGLDENAEPLEGPAASVSSLRRLTGRVARTMYRHGVQRVAPALRRWGAA